MYNHTYQCFWLLIVSVVWSAKMGNFYFHLDPCIAEFGRCRCRIFTSAENQLKKNSTKPNGAHRSGRKSILALSFISSYSTTYTLIHTKIMPHDKTTSVFTQSFWILVETTVLRSNHGTLIFAHHYHTIRASVSLSASVSSDLKALYKSIIIIIIIIIIIQYCVWKTHNFSKL